MNRLTTSVTSVRCLDADPAARVAGAEGKISGGTEGPVMMGGLIGGRAWINARKSEAPGSNPVVVLSGNNQVANFTFLQSGVLADDSSVFFADPPDKIPPTLTRTEQTTIRFQRFWQEINQP